MTQDYVYIVNWFSVVHCYVTENSTQNRLVLQYFNPSWPSPGSILSLPYISYLRIIVVSYTDSTDSSIRFRGIVGVTNVLECQYQYAFQSTLVKKELLFLTPVWTKCLLSLTIHLCLIFTYHWYNFDVVAHRNFLSSLPFRRVTNSKIHYGDPDETHLVKTPSLPNSTLNKPENPLPSTSLWIFFLLYLHRTI